ncbi:histidine phosphatase family protein [Candidatus Pacearchaeota archaeon]|nr:histidine phosphatase family protein [Candidatus Pacearchaeota archaeon]
MKLIIVRHGETVENKEGIMQGQTHGKLSDMGLRQVEKLAEYLKNEKIDLIYSSDLGRCKESLAPLLQFINQKVIYTELLRERTKGIFDGKDSKQYHNWMLENPRKIPSGGENAQEVDARVDKFLKENIGKWKNKTVLIMAHGGTKISLLKILLGTQHEHVNAVEKVSPNAAVTIIEADKENKFFITKLHHIKHLEEVK